jgi:hypothetical protein
MVHIDEIVSTAAAVEVRPGLMLSGRRLVTTTTDGFVVAFLMETSKGVAVFTRKIDEGDAIELSDRNR